ncbi:SusC/RagA family TonB-linked outer membrane protein [Flavivirga spongiicola]|uniref:SusC/RagA family TonB-linked outer membrane protein n=1 Tax=Flavivirga spongiicola TaxID=421621 RepID=A0ABU7XQ02_9FLAO|nr:SusC/RagA family TonB-linked outer membrane protein [Flavivirga sp. MEBiC05379]MDO5977518.1 SusC/RagA family TonB-linked outer membrane protein [Flavivirga sp. MEBiC05379]
MKQNQKKNEINRVSDLYLMDEATQKKRFGNVALVVLCLFFIGIGSYAQSGDVANGKVIDVNGVPLPGASILEKGTKNGVSSDFDGNFSIKLQSENSILLFSYVGYSSKEIIVGSQTNIVVTLEEDAAKLDEVVVIGYGTTTRKEVTGSVASVRSEEFIQGVMTSPLGAVQGKVAGLSIVSSNGSDPNSDYTIRIRGLNSLSGGKAPLIIVDGAVWSGSLKMIDPEQIKTFDILKDGSAAAIYGTRGTNGVVLITLKEPEQGDVKFEFSSFVSYEVVEKNDLWFTADEYRDATNTLIPDYTDLDKGSSTDWLDEVSRNPINQNYNLSITGGKANLAFRANITYKNNEGLFEKNYSNVVSPSIFVTQKAFGDRLTLDYKLLFSRTTSSDIPGGLYGQTITRNPTEPIYDPENIIGNGYYDNLIQGSRNPVAMVNESTFDREVNFINGVVNADYKLMESLSLNVNGSYNSWLGTNGSYLTKFYPLLGKSGQASVGSWNTKSYILEPSIRYRFGLGEDHRFNAIVGYSFNESVSSNMSITNANYDTDNFSYNNIAAGNDLIEGLANISTYKESNKLISFYGRVSYNFKDKYLVSASVRHEGSSRFGENNKWGTFPALSLGWRLNQESFMEDIGFINELKIRAGVGVTGNQSIPNYQSIPRLSTRIGDSSGLFYYLGNWQNVYVPDNNPNPDLKWETKTEYNIGLDFGLFNRVSGSIDMYKRTISDLLWYYNVPVPPNVYDNIYANVGEMTNKGIEILLKGDIVKTPKFNWNSSVTWSKNVNEMVKLSDPSRGYELEFIKYTPAATSWAQLLREGDAVGNFWVPIYVGTAEDGSIIYEDLDGDGSVDENSIGDRRNVGNEYPDFEMGWQNSLTYNKFFLTFSFRAMFGQSLINWDRLNNENVKRLTDGRNAMKSILDHPEYVGEYRFDDRFVDDGTFVKLDNIVFGYDFKFGQNMLKLYVSGRNLLTITNFKGNDPEQVPVGINTDYEKYGGDNLSYPYSRTYLLGLKFNF